MAANTYPEMTNLQEIALLALETNKNAEGNWPNRSRFSYQGVRYTFSLSNEGFRLIRTDSKNHHRQLQLAVMNAKDEYGFRNLARSIETFLTNGAAQTDRWPAPCHSL